MIKTIASLLAAAFLLVGCNTVSGFGQDLQNLGGKLENAGKK